MKKTITALLGVLGLAAVATTAGAAVYPPGASGTGVDVFTGGDNLVPVLGLARGDSVHVRGRTEEYQGETEITAFNGAFGNNKISIEKYSAGNSLPEIGRAH